MLNIVKFLTFIGVYNIEDDPGHSWCLQMARILIIRRKRQIEYDHVAVVDKLGRQGRHLFSNLKLI